MVTVGNDFSAIFREEIGMADGDQGPTDGGVDGRGAPAAGSVGAAVRAWRVSFGLSLQELADATGCAKSFLSALENGRRRAGDGVLGRIEGALGLPAGRLVEASRWERSLEAGGPGVRREVARLRGDREAAARLAALLAGVKGLGGAGGETAGEATGRLRGLDEAYRSGELRRLVDRLAPGEGAAADGGAVPVAMGREVPLINKVAAGYPREFTDLGYPARAADEYVRCPSLDDPDAFAARVVGDSMRPDYVEGDIVVFSPARAIKHGSDCFVRLEPDHEATFKRVYFEKGEDGGELIRLQPLNSAYAPRTVERERVAGLYAAVSVMRAIG